MSEQKPEPLSAEELMAEYRAHRYYTVADVHVCATCVGQPWPCPRMRLLLTITQRDCTIDAKDADLATARRTADEMQARVAELEAQLADWKRNGHIYLYNIIKRQEGEIARKDEALRAAYMAFREYERLHRMKADVLVATGNIPHPVYEERLEKSLANKKLADMCEAALKPAPTNEKEKA